MYRGLIAAFLTMLVAQVGIAQMRVQSPNQPPALEETPPSQSSESKSGESPPAPSAESRSQTKEKLARVWANEPVLVRLARDKFGAELTETDAKFFAAIASN